MHCECFRGGGFWPPTQNGWVVPPPKDRSTSPLKIEGRRVGVEDVVKEVGGDDITERQGGVARANVARVVVGVGSPPSIGCGLEGRTSSGGLVMQGRWRRPVRRRGQGRWRTVRRWPSTIGNGIADGARARDVARVLPHIL
jgi:hypothetical protein